MKNLYVDRLDSFTFDEMLAALQSISQETHRLDFKRMEVGRPKLAHLACAFANADGGIIAIGFNDPKSGATVTLADSVDISDKAKTGLVAAINARVYPPLSLEVCGYASLTGQSFLIIRIGRSEAAPHEYIFPDIDRNLPIRRDTSIGSLHLAEIDALRTRGKAEIPHSPLEPKPFPIIPLMINNPAADNSFVVHLRPETYATTRRIFDADDDRVIADIVDAGRGTQRTLFKNLTGHTYIDGAHFYAGDAPHWSDGSVTHFAPEQATVESDGDIALRFLQNDNSTLYQYLAAIGAAYLIAQSTLFYLNLSPHAVLTFVFRLDARRLKHNPVLPSFYQDTLSLDLAVASFSDAFLMPTLRMFRATDVEMTKTQVHDLLGRFEHDNLPDMRKQWQ